MKITLIRRVSCFSRPTRRASIKPSVTCESLEGRRLLSTGFAGGGMSGIGFGGGAGQGRFGPAEMTQMGSQGRSATNMQQNSSGFATSMTSFGGMNVGNSGSSFNGTFANGRTGNNTPLRPYQAWNNSVANTNNATASESSTDGTANATTNPTTSTNNAGTPDNLPTSNGTQGFMNGFNPSNVAGGNIGSMGGGTFSTAAPSGGGGNGFAGMGQPGNAPSGNMMGGGMMPGGMTGGSMGSPGRSSPFDLSSGKSTSSDVQNAFDTLKTELANDIPDGAKPSYASIGTLMDDLEAIRDGSLTGDAATTQVQADEAAALTELGLTSDQITTIQTDEAALVSAIEAATTSTATSNQSSSSSSATQNPFGDLKDVPLLPFLTQLRQNQPKSTTSSTDTTSTGTATS